MNNIEIKVCKKCGEEKPLNQFYFRKDQNRYINICLLCKKNSNKKYYNDNKNQILKYQSDYYIENKEDRLEYQNQYYKENKEDISIYQKNYKLQNQEKIQTLNKEYYENNKDEVLLQNKHYRQAHHDQIIDKNLEYKKQKRLNDPSFKLKEDVSRMILQGLKKAGSYKNGSSCLDYLSYSFQELKEHLENQFEPWMTWNNWGVYNPNTWNDNDPATWTWQIDHIVPHSIFIYTSMNDDSFKKCWDLNNLRPLNAKQNLLDGVSKTRHNGDRDE